MGEILKIAKQSIDETVGQTGRQYLVGNLASPQLLAFIQDENVEVGVSHYTTFTADKPHIHPEVSEYQYMIEGYAEIKNLLTNEITKLYAGDFFVVQAQTPYAQKNAANTKVIFFKFPGKNDKQLIEVDEETAHWLTEEIEVPAK